jgi:hypothetical protein
MKKRTNKDRDNTVTVALITAGSAIIVAILTVVLPRLFPATPTPTSAITTENLSTHTAPPLSQTEAFTPPVTLGPTDVTVPTMTGEPTEAPEINGGFDIVPPCTSPQPTQTPNNNLLYQPGIEEWGLEEPRQWRLAWWGPASGSPSPIFPDLDAHEGCYSARVEGLGTDQPALFVHSTQPVPANQHLELTFFYKTEGSVRVTMILHKGSLASWYTPPSPANLEPAETWKKQSVEFDTPSATPGTCTEDQPVCFGILFQVRGTGKVWVDDFSLEIISP